MRLKSPAKSAYQKQMTLIAVLWPGSSFSCCPDRQERRLEPSACRRPGRSRSGFRKSNYSCSCSHLPTRQDASRKSRTTNLGPFGEVIRATGPMAKANPFRFCTKYQDDESDLLYYTFRYYNASTGRWLSRDPIEEKGFKRTLLVYGRATPGQLLRAKSGLNPLASMRNDPVNTIDLFGLYTPRGPVPDGVCCLETGYAKTCEQICRLAAANPEMNNPNTRPGVVVCYHGKVCPCIFGDPTTGWTPEECPSLKEIILDHEQDHAGKTKCHSCGFFLAGEDDIPDLPGGECEQRKQTLGRLQEAVVTLNGRCKYMAERWMANLTDWLSKNCH